jgi:hypothetical protein
MNGRKFFNYSNKRIRFFELRSMPAFGYLHESRAGNSDCEFAWEWRGSKDVPFARP